MVLTYRYVTPHFGNLRRSRLSNTMIKGILLLWVAIKSQDIVELGSCSSLLKSQNSALKVSIQI